MQEFTVSTRGEEESCDETTSQHAENQGPAVPPQSDPPTLMQEKAASMQSRPGTNLRLLTMILTVLCLVSGITAMFLGYIYFSRRETVVEEVPDVMGIQIERTASDLSQVDAPASVKGKIFYTDNKNVFVANVDGSDEVQLTNFEPGSAEIKELELIDGKSLGFARCEKSKEPFGCQIQTVDIETKDVRTTKTIEDSELLIQLTWLRGKEYVYVVALPFERKLAGRYARESVETQVFERAASISQREEFIEDDSQLRFSPRKEKFYHIYTKGGRGFDFNVYVYDLSGNLIDTIENATDPSWNDDNTIVYRRYSNNVSGYLYLRDLAKKKSEKIENSVSQAYSPKVLNGQAVFWEASGLGRVYLADIDGGSINLLSKNASFPVWLSEKEVFFARTRRCSVDECNVKGSMEFEAQFIQEFFYFKNLETGEEKRLEWAGNSFRNGVVTWYSRHI